MRISDWSSDVCSSDLPASRAETIGKMMGAPKALASLARYLQQRDVRIVHTNEGPMHVTWGPAARLAGRKLLWHHRSSPRAKGLRFRSEERRVGQECDRTCRSRGRQVN